MGDVADPLTDRDLQLALWILYELHYRGFGGSEGTRVIALTSAAILMLMEEGKLTLADPVSRYIPGFADTKVAVEKKNGDGTVDTEATVVCPYCAEVVAMTYEAMGLLPAGRRRSGNKGVTFAR